MCTFRPPALGLAPVGLLGGRRGKTKQEMKQELGLWWTRPRSIEMTDRLPQSLEVDGMAQWWLSVHITFHSHRTARNRAPFTEPFWPQTKPFSWGKHHPKSHTPQTHCALPHTTPKVSPVSARSQLLQNKSRRPFFGERLYFPFPRNQPPLAVSSNLSSRGIVSLGLR